MAKKKKTKFKEVSAAATHPKRRKGKLYTELLESLTELKPGRAIMVPVPGDVEVESYRNRISAAIRDAVKSDSHPLTKAKNCRFRVEIQEDETELAVRLIQD